MPGLDFTLSTADIAKLDGNLARRIVDKDQWQDPEYRVRANKQRTKRKGKRKAKAGEMAGYVGGGTEAGREAALLAAVARVGPGSGLSDYYTGGLEAADLDNVNAAVTQHDRDVGDVDRGELLVDSESEEEEVDQGAP
jgi:hypothetical protein